MTQAIIGNDPGFDPYSAGRQRGAAGARGRRFRNLLYAGIGLGVAGMILFQSWLFGHGGDKAAAAPEIRTVQAAIPDYPEPPLPVAAPPLPPPAPRLPARRLAVSRPDPRPTQIAFNVTPQGEPALGWFADGRRPHLAHGCALRPGASIIRAVLETTIHSEVGGQAIAQVSEDVYDADRVGRLLIPAGTKVVGTYRPDQLDFQSRRLALVWTELTLPNGEQLSLDQADGMDAAGSMGVGGEVTTRWGDLIATAALLTVFDGIQRSAIPSDNALALAWQQAASNNTGRLGKQITERVLDWKPSILIPGGTQIIIAPQKTIQVC